jgi:hypothetical protein
MGKHEFETPIGRKIYETWEVDSPQMNFRGFVNERFVPDVFLKPLRDSDGQDETLTWKDVPKKEIA